jgi:integrase
VAIHRIKPSSVADLIDNVPGKHPDGGGLYLQVGAPGQASWIYRHKNTWRSLGPADIIDITEARDKALALRKAGLDGQCPIQMLDAGAPAATGKTFGDALADYLRIKSPSWSPSNRAREQKRFDRLFAQIPWFTALPLASITQEDKNKAIAAFEIGTKNHELAGYYVRAVLRYASEGTLLRVHDEAKNNIEHHEAMSWRDVPAFFKRLSEVGAVDSKALAFTILTGSRTSEVIGGDVKPPATWAEIGEEAGKPVWIIGGDRMKARKKHMVPLTPAMMKLLGKRQADDVALFKVSSQSAMLDTLRKITGNGDTVHGFRASFETWGQEATDFSRDLVKLCTAHDKRTPTDKAYARSDQLAKRRKIMEAWSDFLTGVNP